MESNSIFIQLAAWNSMAFLPEFMKSLEEQAEPHRLTVVDNASSDGVVGWLNQEYPQVGVLRNMRNVGFAKAHNQAIQLTLSGQTENDLDRIYIVVSNPDIIFGKDCLGRLRQFMDEHLDIAACTPKILRANLRTEDGGGEPELSDTIDALGLKVHKSGRCIDVGAGSLDRREVTEATEVFGVGGTLSCFRASAVARVIGAHGEFYDEDFLAYQEDQDLAWRMQRLGMKTAVVPGAVAWHHRTAKSSESRNWWKLFLARRNKSKHINFLSTRNHTWLLIKNLTWGDFFLLAPWLWTYESAKLIAALTSWTAIKAYSAALVGAGRMVGKRARIHKNSKIEAEVFRGHLV